MSAGDPEDVVRSVQRWVAYALGNLTVSGDPWSVELAASQVKDVQRPFVLLSPLSGLEPTMRATVPSGDIEWNTSISVNAFPEVEGTPREARARATRVQARLLAALTRGLLLEGPPVERFSYPMDMPLFDFASLPLSGPGRGATVERYGWLEVLSGPCRPVEDPEDDRRFSVIMDLRLRFWAAGADLDPSEGGGVITRAVPGTFVAVEGPSGQLAEPDPLPSSVTLP